MNEPVFCLRSAKYKINLSITIIYLFVDHLLKATGKISPLSSQMDLDHRRNSLVLAYNKFYLSLLKS